MGEKKDAEVIGAIAVAWSAVITRNYKPCSNETTKTSNLS